MTAGEIRKALKGVPGDKEILVSGITKGGKECGNLFDIIEFDNMQWEENGGILKTNLIIDFDAICHRDPVKDSIKNLKDEFNKIIEKALKERN